MDNLSRQYCAYFGEATELLKRHVIGEIIVAFDEYRDSVCQTLQEADNSGPNASAGGGKDINNQEMIGDVLKNGQQQAKQRIVNALNQTLNQPPVLHSPVVSIIENQMVQVNPPGESATSQGGVNFGQNDGDDDSLDVSIKSEVDSSSESECESDETNDDEIANDDEIGYVDAGDDADDNLEEEERFDNMETEESDYEDSMIDEEEDSDQFEDQANMSDVEDNDNVDNDEDYLMNDEDSTEDTTDEDDDAEDEPAAGPSTLTCRRSTRQVSKRQIVEENEDEDYLVNDEDSSDDITDDDDAEEEPAARPSTSTRQVSKRQIVPDRQTKRQSKPIKVKKTEQLRVITLKLKCTVPGCKKVVKNKKALNRHFLLAHKLKRYRCLVRRCYGKVSTSFTTRAQFSDHLDQVHGSTAKLACKCSQKFNSYKQLYSHYQAYHQLGLFACSKDGCTFRPKGTRVEVLTHLRIHLPVNYECPFDGCDRSFKQKCHMNRHRLTHTWQRSFICPECGKSFNQQYNLTVHLRIHRNDKCYRCTWLQCTYSSTQRSNVLRHIRTVHFELPASKRQQAEEEIEDDRDAREYLTKD